MMKKLRKLLRRQVALVRMELAFCGERGAIDKVLIRQWTCEIRTGGTDLAPVWTEVGGIDSVSPGRSKTDADTGDFASAGWDEHLPAGRGRTLGASGHFMEDAATGARDPGQAAVEALGELIGTSGIGEMRFSSPGGNGFRARGSVDIGDPGGSKNDAASWGFTFKVTGQPTPLVP